MFYLFIDWFYITYIIHYIICFVIHLCILFIYLFTYLYIYLSLYPSDADLYSPSTWSLILRDPDRLAAT